MSRIGVSHVVETVQVVRVVVQTPRGAISLSPGEAQELAGKLLGAMAEAVTEARKDKTGCGYAECFRGVIGPYSDYPRLCERCAKEGAE